jgi:hypothetical protein
VLLIIVENGLDPLAGHQESWQVFFEIQRRLCCRIGRCFALNIGFQRIGSMSGTGDVTPRFVKQDVCMMIVQDLLRQLAVSVFLPFVIGCHADNGGNTQANQTSLQFSHVYS